MRRLGLVIVAGGTALLTLHGCGIDVVGFADPNASDATAVDGATSPMIDGAPSSDAGNDAESACRCPINTPAGFTMIAYASEQTAPCAAGLRTDDRITDPAPGPNACSCGGCTVTTPPTCAATQWRSQYDQSSTPSCGSASVWRTTGPSPGACVQESANLAWHSRIVPPDPQGGACASPGIANPAAITTKPARVCHGEGSTCACGSAVAAPFKTCFLAAGDVACPAEAPNKHLIASKAALACDCSCTVTGAKCKASVTWYRDAACVNSIVDVDSESCKYQPADTGNSFRYTATAEAGCQAGPPPAGQAKLEQPDTICCP